MAIERRSARNRARLITTAGVVIILLSAGAALLPFADRIPGANVVGSLLLAAGLVEILAGTQRDEARLFTMFAGGLTTAAGLMLVLSPVTHFFPTLYLVVAWLLLRGLVLIVSSTRCGGSVRRWTWVSAATDLGLGLLLLAGISIATLVVGLFGPTPGVIASFAWILALSFVVNGMMLLETASCIRPNGQSTI
ncbi:MAG: hypothetical protein ACJ8EY_06875 [Sphingomicrobium sp.]